MKAFWRTGLERNRTSVPKIEPIGLHPVSHKARLVIYGATRAAFRASVRFICAGERAAAATRAPRYVLEGTVGDVRATRPIAPEHAKED